MHFVIYSNVQSKILMALLMTLVTLAAMLAYSLTIGFKRLDKIVYENFTNISLSEYVPLDTSDDHLVDDPNSTARNSITTYQQSTNDTLLNDDDLKRIAKENVQKRLEKQALSIQEDTDDSDSTGKINEEEAYGIDRYTEILLTADVLNEVKQEIDVVTKILDAQYELKQQGLSDAEINDQITQIKNNYFNTISNDLKEDKFNEINELLGEIDEKRTELQDEGKTDEEIQKELVQIKNNHFKDKIELLKETRITELEADEEEALQYERYYLSQKIISERLQQDEYKNPYNILPLDLWQKPEKTAKDIFSNKPCMCPHELRVDAKINYSDI